MNDINRIISELERQRIAIERAISALRDVSAPAATTSQVSASKATKKSSPRKKRQLSEEGRQRIIEATKKRWAAKRAADAQKATAKSSAPGRKKRASKKSEA